MKMRYDRAASCAHERRHSSNQYSCRPIRRSARMPTFVLLLTIAACFFSRLAEADEPCNPIIDGTYCATQMPKVRSGSTSSNSLRPIEDRSTLMPSSGISGNPPATLFGLSFQGSESCVGILRRSACN